MGKSNKFDYTNKKNTGVALGQFIAKQLDSEATAVKRTAERQARKHSSSSGPGSVDGESELSVVHQIDLRVPGRELGDDGLAVLAEGLLSALSRGSAEASLALQDVDLSNNGLTTASLEHLATAIETVASFDLRTLNLANNQMRVDTDQDAAHWELFLAAFKDCNRMRKLDLSGNGGLGGHGMEILAKVYVREPHIAPILTSGPVHAEGSQQSPDSNNATRRASVDREDAAELPRRSVSNPHGTSSDRCGLRSIPYINLHGTGITDHGALWLSYVLENHYYPVQLTTDLLAESHQPGLEWEQGNSSMGKDGLILLAKTESSRYQTLLAIDHSKTKTQSNVQRCRPGDRRASLRSAGDAESSDLDHLRKRMQRQIIVHDKPASMYLWQASLQLLRSCRAILVVSPLSRQLYTGELLFRRPSALPVTTDEKENRPMKLSVDTVRAQASVGRRGTYAKTLTAVGSSAYGEPELAITEVTNTPTTPRMVFKSHRKDAFSEGADAAIITEKLGGLILRDPERFVRWQQEHVEGEGGTKAFRDREVACNLPRHLLDDILDRVMPERAMDLMNDEQKTAIVRWGLRRESLRHEIGWWSKDESAQAWMLLDGIKCLEYGQ